MITLLSINFYVFACLQDVHSILRWDINIETKLMFLYLCIYDLWFIYLCMQDFWECSNYFCESHQIMCFNNNGYSVFCILLALSSMKAFMLNHLKF